MKLDRGVRSEADCEYSLNIKKKERTSMSRILVVDDNPANLTQVREILQGEYEVSAVTSGEQALRFLDKREADVILLDLFMAGMDGLQTLHCIREEKKYTGKVMIITALSDSKIEAESRALGADDFLVKPLEPEALKKKVADVLKA